MKRILLTSGIVIAALLAVIVASAALVQFNWMPAAVATRMPFVETFTVEGDVRMTDGTSLPNGTVEVSVQSPVGRTVRAKATAKRNFHYATTFMGFSRPVRGGDNLRIRAVLVPPKAPKASKKKTEEPASDSEAPKETGDASKTAAASAREPLTTLDAPSTAGRVLLADFEVVVNGSDNPSEPSDLPTRLREIAGTVTPSTAAEWKELPLASLECFPNLRLDDSVSLSVEIQSTKRGSDESPADIALPNAANEQALRAIPLTAIGEELARSTFAWEKKRPAIPRTYTVNRTGSVTAQILNDLGVAIRTQQLPPTEGRFPQTLTWEWDGKDDEGNYPPEGDYTFVANYGSLNLTQTPTSFVAETVKDNQNIQRYVELASTNTVGDLMDACAVPVRKGRKGNFEFSVPVQLYRVTLDGKPDRKNATFTGNDTVASLTERFGLTLDSYPTSVTHVAKYRLVMRGGTLRGKPMPDELRALGSAETQRDFLALPLSAVAVADTGERLVPDFQAEYTVTREIPPESPEWGDRSSRQSSSVVVTPSTTVQGLLDQLSQVPGVTATIRGSSTESYRYGARLLAPNGAKLRWMRTDTDASQGPRNLVANIRAAGVTARIAPSSILPIGDGITSIPIEAQVIGLDGKEIANDTVQGTVAQGSVSNGGFFRPSDRVYLAEYVPPVSAADFTVTVEVVSKALSAQSEGDENTSVPDRQTVEVSVSAFAGAIASEPTEPATTPASAKTPAATTPAPSPTTPVAEANLPAATPPDETPTTQPTAPVSQAPSLTTPTGMSEEDVRKLAKVYSRMSPNRAAELLLSLSTPQARSVLLSMKDRDAAKIFDAILGSSEDEAEDVSDDPATAREREARKQSLLDILEGKRKSGK